VPAQTCISDAATREIDGKPIAAQCCDPNDPSQPDWEAQTQGGCRRYTVAGGGDTNAGCIGGKPPTGHTYHETEALCAAAGLAMCDRSCKNGGCGYNSHYVWTNLPCDDPPPSDCPHPTSAPTLTPTSSPSASPSAAPSASPSVTPSAAPTTAAPTTTSVPMVCYDSVAGEGDDWCGPTHAGQATFDASTPNALSDGNVDGWSTYNLNWALDTNNGWRFCGLDQTQCMQVR